MKYSTPNVEENLNQIAKLDPPLFLFTRIETRIDSEYSPVTLSFAGLSAVICCLIIVWNVWLVTDNENSTLNSSNYGPVSIITNSVGLDESNQLYND